MIESLMSGDVMKESAGERNKKRRKAGLEVDIASSLPDNSVGLPETPKVPLTEQQQRAVKDPLELMIEKDGDKTSAKMAVEDLLKDLE